LPSIGNGIRSLFLLPAKGSNENQGERVDDGSSDKHQAIEIDLQPEAKDRSCQDWGQRLS